MTEAATPQIGDTVRVHAETKFVYLRDQAAFERADWEGVIVETFPLNWQYPYKVACVTGEYELLDLGEFAVIRRAERSAS